MSTTPILTNVFINEIHYDNDSFDTGEAIEIAGPAGTDLTGWSLVLYNGSNGTAYDTTLLSGAIPDQNNGFGTVAISYPSNGIQNGSPDGVALVDNNGAVVQFLSYEGSFTAVGGPADGLTSTDIGVAEPGSTPVGFSLQLTGTGSVYEDFSWAEPADDNFGEVNTGQTFEMGDPVVEALISEFQPNPIGDDPANQTFELSGTPGASFSGWIVSIENDGTNGLVDRATEVSGTFDANGLLAIAIPDLENPSFTVTLLDSFTGEAGTTDIDVDDDGVVDDLSTFGTVLDAIGVPDSADDEATLYGAQLGGTDLAFTGDEPRLIFRDASTGDWYAVNDPDNGEVLDASGNSLDPAAFDTNPLVNDTFGAINPTFVGETTTPEIAINELRISSPGSSDDDSNFVEIASAEGTSLDGVSLVVVSNEFEPGQVDFVFNLSGLTIDEDGLLLVANPGIANEIPQAVTEANDLLTEFDFFGSPATFLLVDGFTGAPGADLDTDNDGQFDAPIGTVIDSVALIDGDETPDQTYSDIVVGPSGDFPPAGVARVPDETGDFVELAFDSFATDTPGTSNVVEPPGEITPIYEIQGADHVSPFVLEDGETVVDFFNSLPADTLSISGDTVTTVGIVTAVDSNGFYLQDPTGDDDIATSDAIFVFTSSAPGVAVGDELQVSGTVSEFFPGDTDTRNLPTTQITSSPANIEVLSTGNALPEAVILGQGGRVPPNDDIDDDAFVSFDPETDGIDFFESLEAMRVTAQDVVAVAGTNRFGEIFTVVDQGASATGISDRDTLNISPDDFNPEKIQIDEDSGIFDFEFPDVDAGALLGDVTGVVGYSFGNFEIYPTEDFTANIVPSDLQPESSSLVGTTDQLSVASYNVLNLDPNDADGDTDVADGRFDAIAQQIVNDLNSPDIIALQEVQDNSGSVDDGTIAADETLQLLIDAIVAAGGPQYEYIDNTFITDGASGGQPGGNIRTAYLYNPERVDLQEDSVQTISSQDPGAAFDGARLPLVATFEFNGEEVTLVNNHFSSKGGSAPILGIEQPFEDRQEDVDVNGSLDERQAQSEAVQDYVESLLADDPDANVVVLGDLNEFEFVSPVTGLESAGLNNLVLTVPEDERYSFIFQGNSQQLDHVLVSDSLNESAQLDIVHVNTEFAETDSRASDHDPLLALLAIAPAETVPEVNGIPATIYVNDAGMVVGNAFQAGEPYAGNLFSNTDTEFDDATSPDDVIAGTDGDDNIWAGNEGSDTIGAGTGNDIIGFGSGIAFVLAGEGDDFVYATNAENSSTDPDDVNFIDLGSGNDQFWAPAGNNLITGTDNNTIGLGTGNDEVFTGTGDDFIYTVNGGGGTDVLDLGDGNNTVYVENGNYFIFTGAGDDSIGLGTGSDFVNAGDGDNIVYMIDAATAGSKVVLTGMGDDFIVTGDADDVLSGGEGFNTLFGGAGADLFAIAAGGYNFIGDFELGTDQIGLVGIDLADVSFSQGTGADADDAFISLGTEILAQVDNTNADALSNGANFAQTLVA